MQKLITLVVFFMFSINIYSQNTEQRLDSLEFEIKKLYEEQSNIINKIDLHQSQYKNGQKSMFAGVALSIISTVIFLRTENESIFLMGNGAATILSISGFIMSYKSFNFLKKDFEYNDFYNRYDMTKTK